MNRKYLIIPEYEQLDKTMELAEQYNLGFEYNDFYMPDEDIYEFDWEAAQMELQKEIEEQNEKKNKKL